MPDNRVTVNAAGGGTAPVDTFTQADGDNRQAVVIGDAAAAQTATVDAAGHLLTHGPTSATVAVQPRVLIADTSAEVLAQNTGRLFGSIYNPLTADLYVAFAGDASPTNFTVIVPPRGYFELPPSYTGSVTAISSVAGTVYCTWVA